MKFKVRLSKNNKFITITPTPDFYAKDGLRIYIHGSFDKDYGIPNEPVMATTDINNGQKRYYLSRDMNGVFKADIAHYFDGGREFFVSPDLSQKI